MIKPVLLGTFTALLVALCVTAEPACSTTTANAIAQDLTPAGACIADQLLIVGATSPEQVLAACAGTTINDVIQVVEALIAAQGDAAAPTDAGTPTELSIRLAMIHTRALDLKRP